MFYFSEFPNIKYDSKSAKNLMLRFKIRDLIENRSAVFYNYNVQEGERADVIAYKYYNDETLDWLIWLINDIHDPEYDWPLSYENFIKYINKKYGSVPAAKSEIHHYEWILAPRKKLFDGTTVPERTLVVDQNTYNSLSPDSRRTVFAYDYEEDLNDKKSKIKLLDEKYVSSIIKQVEDIFE